MNGTKKKKPQQVPNPDDSTRKMPKKSSQTHQMENLDKIEQNNFRMAANADIEDKIEDFATQVEGLPNKIGTELIQGDQGATMSFFKVYDVVRTMADGFFKLSETTLLFYEDKMIDFFNGLYVILKEMKLKPAEQGTLYHEFLSWLAHSQMKPQRSADNFFYQIGELKMELSTFLSPEHLTVFKDYEVKQIKEYLQTYEEDNQSPISSEKKKNSKFINLRDKLLAEFKEYTDSLQLYKKNLKNFFDVLDFLSQLLTRTEQKTLYQRYLPWFFHAHMKIRKKDPEDTVKADCKIGEVIIEFKMFDKAKEIEKQRSKHVEQLEDYLIELKKESGILFQLVRETNKFTAHLVNKPKEDLSGPSEYKGYKMSPTFKGARPAGGKFKRLTRFEVLKALIDGKKDKYWNSYLSKQNQPDIPWMNQVKEEYQRYLNWKSKSKAESE